MPRETSFDYLTSDNSASFSTSEKKWIRKILTLSEEYPDEVKIIMHPEENNETLLAHLPKSWFKITPPRKMTLSDEQRTAAAERLAKARQLKGSKQDA